MYKYINSLYSSSYARHKCVYLSMCELYSHCICFWSSCLPCSPPQMTLVTIVQQCLPPQDRV